MLYFFKNIKYDFSCDNVNTPVLLPLLCPMQKQLPKEGDDGKLLVLIRIPTVVEHEVRDRWLSLREL